MARVKVTGYMASDDMGSYFDPGHKMGITDEGYLNANVVVELTDGSGRPLLVGLEEVDYELEA